MSSLLFAPAARLPLSSATGHDSDLDAAAADEPPYYHHNHRAAARRSQHNPPAILSQYDYLRSLISRQRSAGRTKPSAHATTVFCVNLPQAITLPSPGGYSTLSPATDDTMATVYEVDEKSYAADSAPSSPPELAYSKSSKSSSSLASSDDDISENAISEKTPQFEEVALDVTERDSVDDSNLPPDSRPTLRRPPRKSTTPVGSRRQSTSPPFAHFPNGSQSRFPNLYNEVRGVLQDQSLNLPRGSRMSQSATSPTSPYMRSYSHQFGSRSPSPSHRLSQYGKPFSPPASASATPKASSDLPRPAGGRRMSWQPGRKTVKELEAECNDEDDEVPEGAILENVPMSPMPGQQTYLPSPSLPAARSNTPSPHRRPSYANLHSANIPKNARRPSAPPMTHPHGRPPRSPMHGRPPFPHSNTTGSMGTEGLSVKQRSKSWAEDLNVESRRLSQALEAYAEERGPENYRRGSKSGTSSVASSPPRPSSSKRASSSSVQEIPTIPSLPSLPDVQRGNIMIDPLPISKEKEAVLARTRPSWLPPKSKKEEKRHLKEFQQMMARAAEAEKKRAAKDQEARESKVEMQGSIARIWEQHVLPNWDAVVKEPRTRELWWRGVTPHNRGEVWQRAIGNELELSTTSYEAALARAEALESKIASMPIEERTSSREAAWLEAIARDVPAVFPELLVFQSGGRSHEALRNVLKAYTMYRSDVGYVYGTHLIAGLLCLSLPAPQAFIVLANMLNRPLPLAFLVHDPVAMARTHDLVLSTLKYKFSHLHAHLTAPALALHPDEYLDPLFRCLFAYNLPPGHVARIWDLYAFEGDRALIRAAVAVLGRLESQLYGSKDEILDLISWRREKAWDLGDEDSFIQAVREAGKVDARGEMGPS